MDPSWVPTFDSECNTTAEVEIGTPASGRGLAREERETHSDQDLELWLYIRCTKI